MITDIPTKTPELTDNLSVNSGVVEGSAASILSVTGLDSVRYLGNWQEEISHSCR